ncbi:unnamed protein product, partial [Laminaria digitata]
TKWRVLRTSCTLVSGTLVCSGKYFSTPACCTTARRVRVVHQATHFRTRYPAAVLVTMQHPQTTGEKYFTLHTPPTRIHISYRVRVCMNHCQITSTALRIHTAGFTPDA